MAPPPCSRRSLLLVLLGAAALAAPGAEACDPSCRGSCSHCSAAQVVAAMEAAPGDRDV